MKANKLNIQLKNGSAVLREFELTIEDWDIIQESLNYYWINVDRIEKEMLDNGSIRLREAAFYLKKDLEDIKEKVK